MSTMFFYADTASIEILRSGRPKALMLGSDFGYGNFGDVLQHVGAVSRLRKTSPLDLVSIFALEAISRFVAADALRRAYKVDALMFVASEPLGADDLARLGLQQVTAVSDVAIVHLYGGGFLNEMWGDFSLEIAELLLRRLPNAVYVISGQQVSAGYSRRVAEHIAAFKPALVGVRDRDSLRNVQEQGVSAEFSFDDAVEQLLALSRLFQLRQGPGAFIHLNSSGYTGNDSALAEMTQHLALVADRVGTAELPVLFQAFQDGREEVVDSIETVKRLERAFPFPGAQTALLVEAILAPEGKWSPRVLRGEFGYSCSYHVTMWLQLNGVPCWLRGSNDYYDQKRRSLAVEGSFETFLERLPKVDHGPNLEARGEWLRKLDAIVGSAGAVRNSIEWDLVPAGKREFSFKGEPRLEARLGNSWRELCGLQGEKEQLLRDLERLSSESRTEAGRRQAAESELERKHEQLEAAAVQRGRLERELQVAIAAKDDLLGKAGRFFDEALPAAERIGSVEFVQRYVQERQAATESRLLACNDQLTVVGFEARRYRELAETEHSARVDLAAREQAASSMLREILASRSWRWTLPLRAANRFAQTRRFDAQGKVGMFEAARLVGAKLPLPTSWKSRLGHWMRGLRRR